MSKKLVKAVVMAMVVVSTLVVPVAQSFAQHHPSWNQSFGKDARSVDHQKTAMMYSRMLPGVGEWYNRNFEGGFPWGECILGYICCFIRLASVMDAGDGVDNDGWRFNFWVSPHEAHAG